MKRIYKKILLFLLPLILAYSAFAQEKAAAPPKEAEGKEESQAKTEEKKSEKAENKSPAEEEKSAEKDTPKEVSAEKPIIAKNVKTELLFFDNFVRMVFSGIEYGQLNPLLEGDNVIIDFSKPADVAIQGYGSDNPFIKAYGFANDNKSVLFRMRGDAAKMRKFITDNGVGFDVFVTSNEEPKESDEKQEPSIVLMSALPGEDEEFEEEIVEDVAEEIATSLAPLIVTYPLEFVGPPSKDQKYNIGDDFVGPLASDFGNYQLYEVAKAFDDKTIAPTYEYSKGMFLSSMRFQAIDLVGTAFFRNGNAAYLVFNHNKPVFLTDVPKNPIVKNVKQIKNDKFTILKFNLKGNISAISDYKLLAYKNKTSWNIEIHNKNSKNNDGFVNQLKFRAENYFGENRLLFTLKDISEQLQIEDKNTGESLRIFTTSENGVGNVDRKSFVDVVVEASAQGLVVREKSDYVTFEKEQDKGDTLLVTKLPDLFLSEEVLAVGDSLTSDQAQLSKRGFGIFSDQSIFPFELALKAIKEKAEKEAKKKAKSKKSDEAQADNLQEKAGDKKSEVNLNPDMLDMAFSDFVVKSINDIVSAPDNEKSAFKKKLADYYFRKGLYTESMGYLKDITTTDPSFQDIFNSRAMLAATKYLTEKYDEAREEFNTLVEESANSTSVNELKLWGWMSVFKDNKDRRINEKIEEIDFVAGHDKFMQQYPKTLRFAMGLNYIEYLLDHEKTDDAKNILEIISYNGIPKKYANDVKILNAKFLGATGDYTGAETLYAELTNDVEDRKNRAKAIFELNKQKLLLGQIDYKQAVEEFLKAATVWRDDYFEMDVLETSGNIHLSQENYMAALELWKVLVQNFPQTAESVFILGKMKEVFINLFDGGKVYELPPLEVLRIYFRFRELMPVGEVGDRITRKVAEYFLDTDMVDDALEILRHQITYRSKGDEKARLVLWLSDILMEDNKLEEAQKSLDFVKNDILSPEMNTEIKNRKALIIAKKGKVDTALEMVLNDFSYSAETVRIEIFRQRGNWFGVMNKIEPRLQIFKDTFPDSLTKDQVADIFTLAVAYASQNNNEGLKKLNDEFIKRLEDQDDIRLFSYLTSGTSKLDYLNFEQTAELNKIESFLNQYSYLPGNDWSVVASILEPEVEKLVGKLYEELTEKNKNDIVNLALAYAQLTKSDSERTINEGKKKLAELARNFKDVRLDRTTIDSFAVLDDRTTPKETDAVFEAKIKLSDIPEFVNYYVQTRKFSELNIAIRDKFKN